MPSTAVSSTQADFCDAPLNLAPETAASIPPASRSQLGRLFGNYKAELAGTLFILIVGLTLRLAPWFGVPDRLTEDEHLYIANVTMLKAVGPSQYTEIIQNYVDAQTQMDAVMLPPTRCVYILLGWAWDALFHSGAKMSLRYVSAIFSCFSLLLSGVFAYRIAGARAAFVVAALMAASPLELVMAHRELVDGVFAFWTLLSLWLLWENLQRPGRLGWLAVYSGSLAFMVLTKENAFFTAVGICGILGCATLFPGLKLGKVHWSIFAATFAGGALGVAILICLAGSPGTLIEVYRLLVSKAEKMDFAYRTGGGPWFRYIIDLMLISPAVMLLAIGGVFGLRRENRGGIFLLLFVLFSCAVMVNVKNGMNVRYATMWDMPLRLLAAGAILQMAAAVRRWPLLATVALVALAAGIEFHQYQVIFVRHDVGEPVTQYLLYTLDIIRPPR